MKKLLLLSLFTIILKPVLGFTILIDPGHGGEDNGAESKIFIKKGKWKPVKEKDIALSLAKKIHYELGKRKFNSYLTRSVDRTVTLAERADLAEKIKADIFISVHVNSSRKNQPRGFETYYLNNHKDSVVKKVEDIENKNLRGEELIINNILMDLVIDRTVKSSKSLAVNVHSEILGLVGKRYRLKDRGVKPGLFYVLALTKRPAILLEVGFLSNSRELRKIMGTTFQKRYARAVAIGIEKYIKKRTKIEPSLL